MNIKRSNSLILFFPKVLHVKPYLVSRDMVIKGFISLVFMWGVFISTIAQQTLPELPVRKKFIDKVEVFAGPNLSFNYGNMFIENYRGEYEDDNYVTNKRLLKPGYAFGVGAYHSFTERISLNIRILYEQKGTRNELNNPLNPVNNDARQFIKSNYTYKFYTLSVAPIIYFGEKKRWLVSSGVYCSEMQNVKGSIESYNTQEDQLSKGSFEGRFFYHFREDGGINGSSWNPFLSGVEKYDFGIVSSVSYKILINERHSILIQLQDSFGLQDINKNNPYELVEKNHSINLLISYNFNFLKKSKSL